MSPRSSRALGVEGEVYAARYLTAQGYRIVDRNLRVGGVELDLIAARGGRVVFVEVKTRRSRRRGAPEEAVDRRKRARILRAARAWLSQRRWRPVQVRFDVITCEPTGGGAFRLRHLEGAFDANG